VKRGAGVLGLGVLGLVALAGLGTVGFGLWLQTEAGDAWLESTVQEAVGGLLTEGSFRAGDVDLSLLNGRLTVVDLQLTSEAGEALLVLPYLQARFDPAALLSSTVKITSLRVDGPYVDLLTDEAGDFVLARMFGATGPTDPNEPPWEGLPVDLDVRGIDVRGLELVMRDDEAVSTRVAGVDVVGRLDGSGKRFAVRGLDASALLVVPGPLPVSLTGAEVVYDDGHLAFDDVHLRLPDSDLTLVGTATDAYDLTLTVEHLSLPAIDAVAGSAGLTGGVVGSARVVGSASDAKAIVTVDGTDGLQGGLRLRLGADLTQSSPTWTASGSVLPFHVDQALASLTDPIVVQGDLEVSGTGLTWPDDLVADARFTGGRQEAAGLELSSVDLGARIEDGVVYLADDTAVTGIVGRIGAKGWYDVQSGLVDVTASGTLEPTELAALGVEGLGRTGRFEARVLGDTAGDVDLSVIGDVRYAPFVYGSDVSLSQLTATYDLTIEGSAIDGTATVQGRGGSAYGVALAALDTEGLSFSVADDGAVRADGRLVATGVDQPGVVRLERLATTFDASVRGEAVRVEADLELGEHALLDRYGSSGSGRVLYVDDRVDLELELMSGERQSAYVLGRFDTLASSLRLAQLRYAPTPSIAWAADRTVSLQLTPEGGVTDAVVSLRSDRGAVAFTGRAGLQGPLDGELVVDGLQLAMVGELLGGSLEGLDGTVSSTVTLGGTAQVPSIRAQLDLDGLVVPEQIKTLDIDGAVAWEGDRVSPDLRLNVGDTPLAVVRGSLPRGGGLGAPAPDLDGPVDLWFDLRPIDTEVLTQLTDAVPPEQLPRGRTSASLGIVGPLRQPDLHLAGVAELVVRGWTEPGRVEFDVLREGSSLSFWTDLREGFAQRANLGGGGLTRFGEVWTYALEGGEQPDTSDVQLYLDAMYVSGVLLGVPTRSLAAYAELGVPLDGELVGGISVTGSPMQPVVEGGLHWIDARVGSTRFDGAYASFTPVDQGGYELDSQVTFPEGGGLALKGPVPVVFDLERELADWSLGDLGLQLSGEGVPLALLQVVDPGIKKATGLIEVSGAVGGRVDDPNPTLSVSMHGGSLQYQPLAIDLDELYFDLVADRNRIKLERLNGNTTPRRKFRASGLGEIGGDTPRFAIAGSAALEDWTPTKMSAQVRLRDGTWVAAEDDLTLRLDGDVMVSGEWPALEVGGALQLVAGSVGIDAAAFIDSAPLQPDSRMRVVRAAYQREEEEEEEEEPPIYSDFLIDVAVDLKRNLEVDVSMPFIDDLGSLGATFTRADVTTRLGGDLTATLTGGALDLVGEVDVLEGKVRVLRSAFDLQEGNVIFSGGDPFNPNLDLEAVMNIPDATVKMTIAGTPEQPEIDFSSEQYPDQTQIMTILLTGQAPSDLGSDQGQGTAQALAGLLLNSLFAGQSLGSFSIEPDGTVKLGVPVSQSVYANSSLSPTANPTENRLTFGLEWSLLPRVVASGTVGDRTQSADVFWEIRF
jgi:autotransporter translocation and assembly factor TamB